MNQKSMTTMQLALSKAGYATNYKLLVRKVPWPSLRGKPAAVRIDCGVMKVVERMVKVA